jgi:signal transduction histidine kinase
MRCPSLLLALAVALTTFGDSLNAQEDGTPRVEGPPTQRGVLFLAVEDFTRPYVRLMFEAFSDEVLRAQNAPAIYFESLDSTRFAQQEYMDEVREWLRRKYRDTRIDLVVPISEDGLVFLADAHGEPWPTARVLYVEAGSVRVDTPAVLPQAGGLLLDDHTVDALGVIKTILPDTKRVALLIGASALEKLRWRSFADKVRMVGLEPIEIAAMSMEDSLAAMSRLPSQTVVFILQPAIDARGHVPAPTEACELISSAGYAPAFTLGAQDLGCGVVGGMLRDWTIVGRLLGDEVLARLRNPSTEVVNVPVAKYTTLAFDDRQLERWNIPEGRLPSGAVIRFREPNLWRDRRGLVLTVLAVTVLQSFLIAGLVFERRRRRKAEIESRRNLAAMAHLDRRAAMGELATSLAHELNQPLNAILQNAGVAQMMLTSTTVPSALGEMTEILDDIRKDDIRASEVIRRMRGLLQKHELEARPIDLNEVAQETAAIVQPDARARQIEVALELADGVPPILGDRVHLQQVLLNLLMNAMDAVVAVPPERRRVRVRTEATGDTVRLAVSDTGPGIPAERLSKVFEPFYTTKSEGSGMGMGLAIARNIVDAHDGRMAAENNAGAGATVWFSVPASPRGRL